MKSKLLNEKKREKPFNCLWFIIFVIETESSLESWESWANGCSTSLSFWESCRFPRIMNGERSLFFLCSAQPFKDLIHQQLPVFLSFLIGSWWIKTRAPSRLWPRTWHASRNFSWNRMPVLVHRPCGGWPSRFSSLAVIPTKTQRSSSRSLSLYWRSAEVLRPGQWGDS